MRYCSHSQILNWRNVFSEVKSLAYGVVLSVAVALSAVSAWADEVEAQEGLWQNKYSGWTTTADPSVGGTLVPGALIASCAGASYTYNGTTYTMGDSQTWAYSGVMYMNGGVTYRFVKNYDDNGCIIITDPDTDVKTTVILSTSYSETKYGTYKPAEDGYYPIYLAVYNGTGGKGPVSAPFNNASQLGAGLAWTDDPSVTDCTTSNFQKWHKFLNNPGETPIFYTSEPIISRLKISLDTRSVVFDPAMQTLPVATVTDSDTGELLSEGADYTLSYSNTTWRGTAWVYAIGENSYAGETNRVSFKITSDIVLPRGYNQLEYIRSTGTQYIKTGMLPGTTTTVEMDFNTGPYVNNTTFFGQAWSGSQYLFIKQDNVYKFFGNPTVQVGTLHNNTDCHLTINDSNQFILDYVETAVTSTVNRAASGSEFNLFAYAGGGNKGSWTLYSMQITKGGVLERDYVPARRESDGAVGLYDRAHDLFYANAGTGEFVAGDPVNYLDCFLHIAPIESIGCIVGGSACPEPVVTYLVTGALLVKGVDYEVSYTNNTAPGIATVFVTGKAGSAYEGMSSQRKFKVYDGGPAAPYPNLSRSYVQGGLAGFWDAIDNTATGVHDSAAAVWKDLSGNGFDGTMNGLATWVNGNAMHNEADGYPCTIPVGFSEILAGNMNSFEFAFRPDELGVTRVVFSNYKAANYGMIIGHNSSEGTTYADGSIRYYSKSGNTGSDAKVASVVKTNELAYFTFNTQPYYVAAWRDDGKTTVYAANCRALQVAANPFIIGGRDDKAALAMRGDISFLRVYNRTLTKQERELNRAIDLVRYSGRSLKFTLPSDLPDGYALDAERDVLRVRVNANAIGTRGLVSIGGGAPSKLVSAWFDVGETVTMTYIGDGFLGWTNLPCIYTYPNQGNQRTVTFTAGAPVYVNALSSTGDSDTSLTAYSYVQKGLVSLFDGIDNAGVGEHQMDAATPWVDLTGSGRKWVLRGSGAWGGNSLTLVNSAASAYTTETLLSYETAEFCARVSSGNCLFVNADDYSRLFIFSPVYGIAAQRRSADYGVLSGESALVQYGCANTMTAVYRDIGNTPSDIDYFINGAPIPYGRSQAKSYNVGTYPALGSRYDAAETAVGGSLFAVRFYSRRLEPAEVAFNAALDQIRYFCADEAATLSNLTLPDGYRWNSSARCLEVRVDIAAKGGAVSLASGTWFRVGTPVEIEFTPAVGYDARWRGLPLKTTKSDDGLTISFTAAAPAEIEVTGDKGLPALAYVPNGLIGLWDARENIAPGVHDGFSMKWYDLTGSQQEPWTLVRGRSAFRDDAMEAMGAVGANQPDYLASLLPQWYYIEASVEPLRTNSVVHIVSGRYTARHLYLNPIPGQEFVGGYNNSAAKVGLCPSPVAFVRGTYAAAYNSGATACDHYYMNGVELDSYGTYNANFDNNVDYPSLGNRYNAADRRFLGLFNSLRIYSRPLDATEAAFNAAVDRIRYDDALLSEALPETLPDGYRYDSVNNVLEVRIGVFAAEGTLTVNGCDATNLWVVVGVPVEVVYTPVAGRGVRDWSGLPGDAATADSMTRISFTAAAPVNAVVETAAATALPVSTYVSEGLLASWDGLDAAGTTAGWLVSGTLDRRVNAVVFDGKTYMSNYVDGVAAALQDKSMTVEMFIRPRRFIWNGGYIHIGTGVDMRELLLSMQGERDTTYLKAQGGAFGALQFASTASAITLQYCGVRKNTDAYFGQDTSVAIIRDDTGAKLALNDEGFCLTNNSTSYTARPTSDLVNVGTWLGKRNASFDLYAVRIYKRILTDGERAFNRAVDRARFTDAGLVLPEGFTNDAGVVKAKYTVAVTDGTGLVSVNGGTPAAAVEAWLPMGSTASVVYTPSAGCAIDAWTGFPDNASYFDGGARVTLKVTGPLDLAATGQELEYSDDNFDATAAIPSATALGNSSVYSFTNGVVTLKAKRDLTIEQALVVGGGGAGGNQIGGGGGGGGVIYVGKKTFVPAGASIMFEVGAGGAVSTSNGGQGGKGASSFLRAGDLDIEAFGGGGGGSVNAGMPSGGGYTASSGGSANQSTTAHIDGWNYTSSQGHTGGISYNNGTYKVYGAGGGGALWSGESTLAAARGYKGGQGLPYYIGAEVGVYGAGGGGGGTIGGVGGTNAGAGGSGTASTNHGTAGTDGYGAGGGGGGNQTSTRGGAGGAGAVIFAVAEGNTTERNLEVTLPERVIYLGSPVTPKPIVTLNGAALEKDVDYTVSYVSNAAPGFAGVLVAGIDGTAAEGLTATRAFVVYKGIFASAAGAGTQDGSSWANAMAPQAALTAAKTNAFDVGAFPAVLFKSGTYPLDAALSLGAPGLVLGGYLGAAGVSLELDESNPETMFDGQGTKTTASTVDQALKISSPLSGATNVVERCAFYWCRLHGFMKEGASSIVLRKCRFNCNAADKASSASGRGFHLTGTKDATAVIKDCDVSGQIQWNSTQIDTGSGFGGYISTFRRVYIDNTTFATNGWVGNYRSAQASALYVTGAPLTMRNSRIVANQLSHPANGGTVCLVGNCGGSAFTNCLFVANANRWYGYFGNGGHSGALHVRLTSPDDTVDLDHCTFAYNLQGSMERVEVSGSTTTYEHCSAAGLDVDSGTVKVRNSIFWGNAISSENGTSADLYVHSGRADVDYTLFAGVTPDYVNAYPGAEVVFGEHIIIGDPRFATGVDTVKTLSGKSGFGIPRFSTGCSTTDYAIGNIEGVAAIDVHVSSVATNYSPAIDGSIPSWPVGSEPEPNGGIANLGFYGTTAEAATSILGAPSIVGDEVDVTFPPETAGPRIAFTLGDDGIPYNATALVEVSGGGQSWTHEYGGLHAGDEFVASCPVVFPLSTEITVRVTVSAPGQTDVVVTTTATTPGSLPPWYGHGGDPNKVVHVRVGSAAENPKGTSWEDAYPDVWTAASALTETRNEIWFAGEALLGELPPAFNNEYETVIRGGFTGTEDSADERADGVVSTIDGDSRFQCMRIYNHSRLTIERVDFKNGYPRAVLRGDALGDLVIEDCGFYANGATNAAAMTGCAVYFYRNYYGAANLFIRRCRFEGNGRRFDSDAQLDGACIYLNASQKSLVVEDSVFLTNGAPFSAAFETVRPVGSCIYSVNTPVTVTRCRFSGNRACSYKTENQGGVIYLNGTCGGSRIENCAFIANESVARTSAAANLGELGGAVVVNLDQKIRVVDIENCTFAWNLASGKCIPTDILAYKGTVNLRNSIFLRGLQYATAEGTGRYVHAAADGVVNVNYTMFDVTNTVAVAGPGSITVAAETCMLDLHPSFVSGDDLGLRVRNSDAAMMAYDDDQEKKAASGDVHLLSDSGYVDNQGVYHDGCNIGSSAIDAGDPASDSSNEPEPNGGVLNLGAYGNTIEASRTYRVSPVIVNDEITISFPDGRTFPKVEFDLEYAKLEYTATVQLAFSTNNFATEVLSPPIPARGGEHFSYLSGLEPYTNGSTLYVRVIVKSGENIRSMEVSETVVGNCPAWWNAGGGEGILHVWADAPGDESGSGWRNAFHDIESAMEKYTSSVKEIWLAGDFELTRGALEIAPMRKFTLRGGFTATESSPMERPAGTVSVIDAKNTYDVLHISNSYGISVELDRLSIYNGYNIGIRKTNEGNLVVTGCLVLTNGQNGISGNAHGKGMRITSAAGANILITNTVFMGNMLSVFQQQAHTKTGNGNGSAIYIDSGASFTAVDSCFYGNGYPNANQDGSHSENPRSASIMGGAVYATVPVVFRGCRFCGNRLLNGLNNTTHYGGILALRGNAGGSRIENCVFAANLDTPNGSNPPQTGGAGAVAVVLSSREATVDIVNCTFAYNVVEAKNSASALTVFKGTVNLKNSIFYGNVLSYNTTDHGVDLNVHADGVCKVKYTLFSEPGAVRAADVATFCAAGGELDLGPGVIYANPLLVTEIATVTNLIENFNAAHIRLKPSLKPDATMQSVNVHLLGRGGYYDEHTGEFLNVIGKSSPAIDAGDPSSAWSQEPNRAGEGYPGRRINLGRYGNTPWATMTPHPGNLFILR